MFCTLGSLLRSLAHSRFLSLRAISLARRPLQWSSSHLFSTNGAFSGWRAAGQQPNARCHDRNTPIQQSPEGTGLIHKYRLNGIVHPKMKSIL